MNSETRAALEAADDATAWEFPPGFDYGEQMGRVEVLRSSLQAALARPVEIDRSVQDASFFAELSVVDPDAKPVKGVLSNLVLGVRLSAFGRLSTVWSCCREGGELPEPQRQLVVAQLVKSGYQYVPADELQEPYDGVHSKLRAEHVTWWTRFFDYL